MTKTSVRTSASGWGAFRRGVTTGAALALVASLLGPAAPARAASDPASEDACVLQAGPDATREHEGVTDYDVHLRPDGQLDAIVLFVDFDDAPSDDDPSAYFDRIRAAADWLTVSSYGRLDVDLDPVLEWYRMPEDSTDYGITRGLVFEEFRAYMADAVRVATDDVDFSGYDLLYVVSPETADAIDISPAFVAAEAHGIGARDDDPDTDGNVLRYGANVGDNVYDRPDDLEYRVPVHETGHVFGLPDLYAYSGSLHRFVGEWDLMGRDEGDAPDFLAWHKRKLGWLDADQLVCVTEDGSSDHTLSPVEAGGGTKAVVVPTGEHTALVAERRARRGVDADICSEGVLVYEVDSNRPSGEGPVRIRTPDGSGPRLGCSTPETFAHDRDDGFYDPDAGVAVEVLDGDTIRVHRGVTPEPPEADAGGPYTTDEGEQVSLDGSASSDPNPGDDLSFEWDLDGDGVFDDGSGPTPTFRTVGRDGVFDATLRVTDTSGATDTDETTVTVRNVAPTLEVDIQRSAGEGDELEISGVVRDAGWLDPLDVTIDAGGGETELTVDVTRNFPPEATVDFEATHVYGDDGAFTLEVCGLDDDTRTCTSEEVEIGNVAPTASIEAEDSTVIVEPGSALEVQGRAIDPGSDDLELTWDYGDGSTETTTSLVNPPHPDGPLSPTVQPRDVTDAPTHTYDEACTYEVTFTATDDDGGSATDALLAIVTGDADDVRGAGYWTHEMRGNGRTDHDAEALGCRLEIVGALSEVFHDLRDASTTDDALDVLRVNGTSDVRELLDRQLLAAWLNVASGAVALDDPVDTDGDGEPDASFAEVITDAEDVRGDPDATRAELEEQKDILERINGAR